VKVVEGLAIRALADTADTFSTFQVALYLIGFSADGSAHSWGIRVRLGVIVTIAPFETPIESSLSFDGSWVILVATIDGS